MLQARERIVVTQTGVISALGSGASGLRSRLRLRQHGLNHPQLLHTRHASEFVLAEVLLSNEQLAANLKIPAGTWYSRTTLLALAAIEDLLQTTDLDWLRSRKLALVNANTVGGMREVEKDYMAFIGPGDNEASRRWTERLDCADSTEAIARHFSLEPLMATISTACSSSANSLIVAARMLRQGLADVAIAGGCDALSRFTLNGFLSLKNMAKSPCRPFDRDRSGLNLGEGAAYLMLERESDALRRGAGIIGVLSGWSNSNDAYHPTAPSPDGAGALYAMQEALRRAALSADRIGYINAHGTATFNNDVAEGLAMQTLWHDQVPAFSSTKPYTGHTLAAAGAIEAIISLITLQTGEAPPNLNWSQQMDELSIQPLLQTELIGAEHVMSNSFGFGGNNVSLVFSRS